MESILVITVAMNSLKLDSGNLHIFENHSAVFVAVVGPRPLQ